MDHRNHLETANDAHPSVTQEFVQPHDAVTNFEPSLVVVVTVLAFVFSLTILLLFYFKSCRNSTITGVDQQDNRRPSVFFSPADNVNSPSGLDEKAIQNLPFFRFGVLRGSREGLECSVCLSKYEEAEILRLLPKCRHAFHVDCVDRWLSHHSTCPLCRSDVAVHDSSLLARSNSIPERAEDSISIGNYSNSDSIANEQVELFVEREEEESGNQESILRRSSSILSVGTTFRRLLVGEDRVPITACRSGSGDRVLHKHNHKIVFSDVVFKNRWSNVNSSDLRFLNSELIMLSRADSDREQSAESETARAIRKTECSLSIGEEVINKKRISIELAKRDSNASCSSPTRALLRSAGAGDSSLVEGRRSVSEITLYSRFKELGWLNYSEKEDPLSGSGSGSGGGREEEEGEKKREIWFPIARKTVECFANARREETDSRRNHRRVFK